MSRYLAVRTFPEGLNIPVTDEGAASCLIVVNINTEDSITWVHSYVSDDKRKTYYVYDGPSPEAIRKVAERNHLPVDRITRVSVLDPYFYRQGADHASPSWPSAPRCSSTRRRPRRILIWRLCSWLDVHADASREQVRVSLPSVRDTSGCRCRPPSGTFATWTPNMYCSNSAVTPR